MKFILKIGKLLAILILTVSVILLAASVLLKDKVGFIILKSLNKNLSTKLDVGSYRLSLLRKFPEASLELKDVLVHSSSGYNKAEFKGINTDTLLSAHSVSVEFKIIDIIKGNYTIDRIGARLGRANFFTDSTGHVNYSISVKSSTPGNDITSIDLKRINLADIDAYYNDLATHLIIRGTIRNGKLKSRISGENIDFTAVTELQIKYFQLYTFQINKPLTAKLDLILQSSKNGVKFRKGDLNIANYEFGMNGFVSSDNFLDIDITGKNLDLSGISDWLPEKYQKQISDYDPDGIITVKSKIKGQLNRTSNPHIEADWQLTKGRIAYKRSDITLRDMSFAGHFTNGSENRPETSSVSITDFKAVFGSAEYTGSATLKDFNDPVTDIVLKGRVFPGELKDFFNVKDISAANGSFDIDLKIINGKWPKKSFCLNDIIDLKPEADITFNSCTIGLQNNKYLFSNVIGNLIVSNSVVVKNFKFNYKNQNIKIDGKFNNFPEWLSGRSEKMEVTADVTFDKLIPEAFFNDAYVSDKSGKNQKAIILPEDIILNINFRIDSLIYKTFTSSEIGGTLNYRPKLLTFKSLNMHSLNGMISGNGVLVQNNNNAIIAKGNFAVTDIDIKKAFTVFHNFGQSFLKAENIKGTLSGSLSILFPVDSLLKFDIKTLTAEGKYLLINGALINFDPVKQLSSFIALSELENISFEKLENDFFIKNNYLYIPQMEVNSSAADLSVNGKHSFDNDYEYHVRIRLSEILSKKRAKNKSNVTEFGVVEDDGLGRTSLLLKILGKGDVAKVSYDMKAASTEVKNDLKKEKQSLKTILNQEYGWYKKDSTINKKPAEKKTKFRIKWDDSDTVSH